MRQALDCGNFARSSGGTLGIGIGFAAFGARLGLPFAGLQVALLAAAFLVNGRHAADYELEIGRHLQEEARIEFAAALAKRMRT